MPPSDPEVSGQHAGRPSKVRQLIEMYELAGLGEALERRWTAPEPDRASLRDLAADANQQALRHAMQAAGLAPLAGEVENTYRLLVSDDVEQGACTRATRRLEREGIDVDALQADFVSYQAIRRYLTNHRDAEYTTADRDQLTTEAEALKKVLGRTETIALTTLTRLRDSGDLTLGEFTVSAPIRVFCSDCGTRYDITDLLAREACECGRIS